MIEKSWLYYIIFIYLLLNNFIRNIKLQYDQIF